MRQSGPAYPWALAYERLRRRGAGRGCVRRASGVKVGGSPVKAKLPVAFQTVPTKICTSYSPGSHSTVSLAHSATPMPGGELVQDDGIHVLQFAVLVPQRGPCHALIRRLIGEDGVHLLDRIWERLRRRDQRVAVNRRGETQPPDLDLSCRRLGALNHCFHGDRHRWRGGWFSGHRENRSGHDSRRGRWTLCHRRADWWGACGIGVCVANTRLRIDRGRSRDGKRRGLTGPAEDQQARRQPRRRTRRAQARLWLHSGSDVEAGSWTNYGSFAVFGLRIGDLGLPPAQRSLLQRKGRWTAWRQNYTASPWVAISRRPPATDASRPKRRAAQHIAAAHREKGNPSAMRVGWAKA